MVRLHCLLFFLIVTFSLKAQNVSFSALKNETLEVPEVSDGTPKAGKRVKVFTNEYAGTNVYHTVYLPQNWKKEHSYPIIFEYTGNKYPPTGSSGEVKDANLGYGLSAGQFIWVSLPYIAENGEENQLEWWGDIEATVNYAKNNVPQIIEEYGADRNAVYLCGFSRGAIGVNFLGLHDDEVAKLWTAFVSHDHFDGVRSWGGTEWGCPLGEYRKGAAERLKRIKGRPYLVIQNGEEYGTKAWVNYALPGSANFTYLNINTEEIFDNFPNEYAKHQHTDNWCVKPGNYRDEAWIWMEMSSGKANEYRLYEQLCAKDWNEVFFDTCTDDWEKNWILDGKKGSVLNTDEGMDFLAGPKRRENASHAVLWTKQSFEGDIKIEYEYTKINDVIEAVTILYIQASGSGAEGFEQDIMQWADKREVPAMKMYFNHMNTYHISYAAFDIGNLGVGNDYIRARRYIPEKKGLKNTDLSPDYFKTGLFEEGVRHKITVIKKGDHLFMHIQNTNKSLLCHWLTDTAPPVKEGRIGLRHMWTRGARYKNFKVSQLQ